MTCEHEWEAVKIFETAFKFKKIGIFICQKCMSYKEEELKFIKREKEE